MKKLTLATILLSTMLLGGLVANADELTDISNVKDKIEQLESNKQDNISNILKLNEEIRTKESLKSVSKIGKSLESKETKMSIPTLLPIEEELELEEQVIELKNELKLQNESIEELKSELNNFIEFDKKLDNSTINYNKEDKSDMNSKLTEIENRISEITSTDIEFEDNYKVEQSLLALKETKTNLENDIKNHVSDKEKVVQTALSFMGTPYVWGGKSVGGMDCSGLTLLAYQTVGRDIGIWTVAQESSGTTISLGEAERGDLLFWGGHGGTHHVGIYLGDGTFVHAPTEGEVVKITNISDFTPDFAVRVM